VFDHPGLRVFAASPEHLLAMKAFAARPRDAAHALGQEPSRRSASRSGRNRISSKVTLHPSPVGDWETARRQ
jgi:hypothetical protein